MFKSGIPHEYYCMLQEGSERCSNANGKQRCHRHFSAHPTPTGYNPQNLFEASFQGKKGRAEAPFPGTVSRCSV